MLHIFKKLFSKTYRHVGLFTTEQVKDRICRLMSSEDGETLALVLANRQDQICEQMCDEKVVGNALTTASYLGELRGIRNLQKTLLQMSLTHIEDKKRKQLQKNQT